MDRPTKVKLAAGAAAVALIATAFGALGALALSDALSSDGESFVLEDDPTFEPLPLRGFSDGGYFGDRGFFGDPGFFGDGAFAEKLFAFPGPGVDLDEAASYLELSEDELRDRLEDGDTLADVARDEGKSVAGLVDALEDAARERLDDAVDDGRLDPEHAERLEENLEERIDDAVNRDLGRGTFAFDLDCD